MLSDYLKSKYYRKEVDGKMAIFEMGSDKRVTEFYDYISVAGLASNQSDFFIATKDGKKAIFWKSPMHSQEERRSEWFDDISLEGAVEGENEFYIAIKDGKYAIFNINGEQISDWQQEEIDLTDKLKELGLIKENKKKKDKRRKK